MLRVPVSGFSNGPRLAGPAVELPETAIPDLQQWTVEAGSNGIRRNLRTAARAGLEVAECDPGDAERCYRLYRSTITRHGGRLRYSRAYFGALLELAERSSQVRCFGVRAAANVVGFVVVARSGATAYYLHGAIDMHHQASRPMDALFYAAICWSQKAGAESFNMMSSPRHQPGLVRYKEKWGGETRLHCTYDLARSKPGKLVAWAAQRVARIGRSSESTA